MFETIDNKRKLLGDDLKEELKKGAKKTIKRRIATRQK